MRLALFITCFNDLLFPQTGRAVVCLLERLGHRVEFPLEQTCCGQMHFNTGYQREYVPLVTRFADGFAPYDAVVTPSGSCAGMIREHHPLLAAGSGDDRLIARVGEVAPKAYELCEFLVDVLEVTDVGAYYPHRVTYHPTCHSLRMLHVGDRPLRLLREVRGFGGTFAIKNAQTSTAMLADKVRHVLDTGAEVCTAGDNSCLLHIGGGLSRLRAGVRTVHLAEVLAATEERSTT